MSKGYLCLVTPAGRLKAGLTPGSIFMPYCKSDLDNTRISKEMVPTIKGVTDKVYRCVAPGCQVNALDMPSITNHVRTVHTNSLLGCYYYQDPPYGVASAKAWKPHNDHLHPNVPHYWNKSEAMGQAGALPSMLTSQGTLPRFWFLLPLPLTAPQGGLSLLGLHPLLQLLELLPQVRLRTPSFCLPRMRVRDRRTSEKDASP